MGKDVTPAGSHTFADGLFGRALRSGRVMLPPGGLVDTASPGSLIFWTALTDPVKEGPFEPGASPFVLNLPGGKRVLVFKQGRMPWGSGNLQVRAEIGKNVCAVSLGDPVKWIKPGSWRMIAVNWGPERLGISLNGNPMRYASLIAPPGRSEQGVLMFSAPEEKDLARPECLRYLLDEIVILDRNLTDDEIRRFYEASLPKTIEK